MEHKIDVRQALEVFTKVTQHGEKDGEDYCLDGLRVSTDFDGYTVFLRDDQVSLTIHFHNKYDIDFPSRSALENFLERLRHIAARDYR